MSTPSINPSIILPSFKETVRYWKWDFFHFYFAGEVKPNYLRVPYIGGKGIKHRGVFFSCSFPSLIFTGFKGQVYFNDCHRESWKLVLDLVTSQYLPAFLAGVSRPRRQQKEGTRHLLGLITQCRIWYQQMRLLLRRLSCMCHWSKHLHQARHSYPKEWIFSYVADQKNGHQSAASRIEYFPITGLSSLEE